eukprot:4464411-Amphidinium_carterae.1
MGVPVDQRDRAKQELSFERVFFRETKGPKRECDHASKTSNGSAKYTRMEDIRNGKWQVAFSWQTYSS